MARIPDSTIDSIQQRVDIAEVIGRTVALKRAGRYFKANCPFHREKTPSFMVNPEKQIFHCFGCGVGGNVFTFLMQHDRLTFPEAARLLADQVGVRLEEERSNATPSKTVTETCYNLLEKACAYYERLLHAPQSARAHAYVLKRGVSEEACKCFRLGVSAQSWDQLAEAAGGAGVLPQQLEAVGLAIAGKSGHYDRFRNRVLFPVIDVRGRVVGFGGRSLDGQEPKYLNSPETAIYSKGRHLFGLFQAREAIVAKKTAVVVEGYFDCVVLSSAGIRHVVSPLGTALTLEQGRLLKRYAESVILAFDADAAGEQASLRGIEVLVELGLEVSVARLPQDVDPDEYVQQHGSLKFEEFLSKSINLFDFLLASAQQRYPADRAEERVKAAQFVLHTLRKVPNTVLRREYVHQLAGRLHLDEAALLAELKKLDGKERSAQSLESYNAGRETAADIRIVLKGPEALLVAMMLDAPQRWLQARESLDLNDFTEPALRRVLSVIEELHTIAAAPPGITTAQVLSRLAAEGHQTLAAALIQMLQSAPSNEDVFEDCLKRLQRRALKQRAEFKRDEIRKAQEAGQTTALQQLLSEYQELMVQVKGG